jgi:N utilization substance protein B
MQARRASRELAFIVFSQFKTFNGEDLDDVILKSVRVLKSNAEDELKLAHSALVQVKDQIEVYESDHETNLSRPVGVKNVPVALPLTSYLSEKIELLNNVANKAFTALEVAEFVTLSAENEVKDYAIKIISQFQQHSGEVDEIIKKYAKNWNLERLVKMDKDILRIAIAELLYTKDAPMKVIVDEALELAKKYSTDDSASFINGILAKVIVDYDIS